MGRENLNLLGRYAVGQESVAALTSWREGAPGDRVYLSRNTICDRFGLRGVPRKRVDVLIEQRGPLAVLELASKHGKFDGAERPRMTLRRYNVGMGPLPTAKIEILADSGGIEIAILSADPAVRLAGLPWARRFATLSASIQDYNLARVVMWHWRRYYQHLPEEVVRQAADVWALTAVGRALAEEWTLARANQEASRELYRLSREEGWRKLTLREREKLGHPEKGQWQRDETVVAWMAAASPALISMGVGERTVRWAHEDYLDVELAR